MKHILVEPGANPMEMPELIRRKRIKLWQSVLIIGGGLLLLALVCGGPVYFLTKPKTAEAQAPTSTYTMPPTATSTPTPTTSPTTLQQTSLITAASPTYQSIQYVQSTAGPTQTPRAPATVVVYRQVEVTRRVEVQVEVTRVVTATQGQASLTPRAMTQTPWVITVIVPVTVTNTPTATATQNATKADQVVTVAPAGTSTPTGTSIKPPTLTPKP